MAKKLHGCDCDRLALVQLGLLRSLQLDVRYARRKEPCCENTSLLLEQFASSLFYQPPLSRLLYNIGCEEKRYLEQQIYKSIPGELRTARRCWTQITNYACCIVESHISGGFPDCRHVHNHGGCPIQPAVSMVNNVLCGEAIVDMIPRNRIPHVNHCSTGSVERQCRILGKDSCLAIIVGMVQVSRHIAVYYKRRRVSHSGCRYGVQRIMNRREWLCEWQPPMGHLLSCQRRLCAPLIPPTPCIGPTMGRPPIATDLIPAWVRSISDKMLQMEAHTPS